ncbi:AlbA family DNA-binding domain-containing protein [Streptomyces sp. NPDC001595]|uniref:AlbA family DNA-binding domain-containing protein n=1 Tax=Streptomyces sp. NPDC001532 TaxID=3154520 RepID=UPI0033201066
MSTSGAAPGPLGVDIVAKAAGDRLAESDDLDWKEQLPQPPCEGRWNELAKDVAAMANTRGGLIIFGVRDTTCELVGITPGDVNTEQYARSQPRPALPVRPHLRGPHLSKADQDPALWLPTFASYYCQYLADWVAIKLRRQLAVDPAERDTLTQATAACPNAPVEVTFAR